MWQAYLYNRCLFSSFLFFQIKKNDKLFYINNGKYMIKLVIHTTREICCQTNYHLSSVNNEEKSKRHFVNLKFEKNQNNIPRLILKYVLRKLV